jgi:hypothetical protein
MEYYPSFFPETALALLQALFWSMACVLLGAALIALCVYIVLVSSEILSHSASKPKGAKVPQAVRPVHVAEGTLDPPAAAPILLAPEILENAEALVNVSLRGAHVSITVPAALEAEVDGP